MNKLERVESALINTANLDPADFTLIDYYGGMEVIHKATGHKIKIQHHQYIRLMGSVLEAYFVYLKEIPPMQDGDYIVAWNRWKRN